MLIKPRRRYLKWHISLAIVASVIPSLVLLTTTYNQTISTAESHLNQEVELAKNRADNLLAEAESILYRLRQDTDKQSPTQSINLLRRIIYNDPRFREAGIVNEAGFLVATNFGTTKPPLKIADEQNPNFDNKNVQIVGLFRTTFMQEKSIIISLPTTGYGRVNLLVDPIILTEYLNSFDLGPEGFIIFENQDGQLLSSLGNVPQKSNSKADDGKNIRITKLTENGKIKIIASLPVDWVLRDWHNSLLLTIILGVLCTGLLIWTVIQITQRSIGLDQEVLLGLHNNEFILHYQPIFDLKTRQCIGSEALIRWQHPHHGLILPDAFIPVAEETGIIAIITDWVIQQAIQDQTELLKQFPELHLAINLSATDLSSQKLIHTLSQALEKSSISFDRIIFEITEQNYVIETDGMATKTISAIRSLSSQIAIDDFGTGYSSLGYLRRFEFDYLKIDRSFTRCIDSERVIVPIIETIIDLSHKLGVKIIAEGVETEEQFRYLTEKEVEFAQGWLFSKSLDITQFKSFVMKQKSNI